MFDSCCDDGARATRVPDTVCNSEKFNRNAPSAATAVGTPPEAPTSFYKFFGQKSDFFNKPLLCALDVSLTDLQFGQTDTITLSVASPDSPDLFINCQALSQRGAI